MQENTRSNKKIDAIIFSGGQLAMDETFALEMLAKYQQDLSLLEAGATYAELGIADRRKSSLPSLLSFDEQCNVRTEAFTEANIDSKVGSFAHLRLSGMMQLEDGLSSRGINSLVGDIRRANASPNVAGILLEINSGGGEALSGGELMNAIKDSNKPVVVYAQRIGSAAYRGALHANKIVLAGNDAQAGSIGAFISLPKGFADWYNANYEDIYATQSSGKNADFRGLLNGSTTEIQKVVNETARIFQADVKRARTLTEDTADETLSGGMFFAADAKKRGLVDEIGTFDTAIKLLASEVRKAGKLNNIKSGDMSFLDKILGREPEPVIEEPVVETPETPDETPEAVVDPATPDVVAQIKDLLGNQAQSNADLIGAIREMNGNFETKFTTLANELATLKANQKNIEEKVVAGAAPVATKNNAVPGELTTTEKTFLKVAKVGGKD